MIKREYIVRNNVLGYDAYADSPGTEEHYVECTPEEITEIVVKQNKDRAELSDEYLEKLENKIRIALKPLSDKLDVFMKQSTN